MSISPDIVDKKGIIKSVITGLVFALFGLAFFLVQRDYAETGHDMLLITYIVMAILLIIPVYFSKKGVATLMIIIMIITIAYAWMKFDWRSEYIKNAENGHPFALETYIDGYPTFEDHYFSMLSDNPLWVHFANDCYLPALNGETVGADCRSQSLIDARYNINMRRISEVYYRKMRKTATMLQQGQLLNKEQYRNCLAKKRCAVIPLLPTEAEGKDVTETSADYIDIRRQFWSLVNDDEISPEICEFMDLCRVMRDLNVVPIEKPQS